MISIADILSDPERAGELPPEMIPALMAQCAAIQAVLAGRLLEARTMEAPTTGKGARDAGRWLTAEEAGNLSNLGTRWFYRNWHKVPGAKKFSRRRLRFHEPALCRWLKKGT